MGRSVLDAPHARGTTEVGGARACPSLPRSARRSSPSFRDGPNDQTRNASNRAPTRGAPTLCRFR